LKVSLNLKQKPSPISRIVVVIFIFVTALTSVKRRSWREEATGGRRAIRRAVRWTMGSSRMREEPGTRMMKRRRMRRRMGRIGMVKGGLRKGRRDGKDHTLYRHTITITITHHLGMTRRGREERGLD
jgi:hypothetical protein